MFSIVKRHLTLAALATALTLGAVGAPLLQPAAAQAAVAQAAGYTKILISSDGKLILVCRYDSRGRLLYCDVYHS